MKFIASVFGVRANLRSAQCSNGCITATFHIQEALQTTTGSPFLKIGGTDMQQAKRTACNTMHYVLFIWMFVNFLKLQYSQERDFTSFFLVALFLKGKYKSKQLKHTISTLKRLIGQYRNMVEFVSKPHC